MLYLPGSNSDFDTNLTDEELEDFADLVTLADDISPISDSNIGIIAVNELLNDYENTDGVDTY